MKLQVTQENLNKALGSVARVASGRNTLPILANVLIKTVGNRLSVAATNLDIAITHYIGSKVSEEGSITIPARLVQDFVNSLPSGVIELELDEYKLHFKTESYKSTINGVLSEEFPVLPAIKEGRSWTIPAPTLKNKLQQTIIAASNDETRPVLTGVFFHGTEDAKLVIVATDSYRLAEAEVMPLKDEVEMLVPVSATQELLRVISDYEGDIKITHDDQQVLFQAGDIELVARLIEGNYPKYNSLIPKKFATSVDVSRAELLNIAKVSSLFARENAGSITIEVDESSQNLSIQSIASQLGENTASAKGKVKGSGSITINSRYLLDALHVLNGEKVTFSFNGKLEPSILKETGASDYIHVIMPLKS